MDWEWQEEPLSFLNTVLEHPKKTPFTFKANFTHLEQWKSIHVHENQTVRLLFTTSFLLLSPSSFFFHSSSSFPLLSASAGREVIECKPPKSLLNYRFLNWVLAPHRPPNSAQQPEMSPKSSTSWICHVSGSAHLCCNSQEKRSLEWEGLQRATWRCRGVMTRCQ